MRCIVDDRTDAYNGYVNGDVNNVLARSRHSQSTPYGEIFPVLDLSLLSPMILFIRSYTGQSGLILIIFLFSRVVFGASIDMPSSPTVVDRFDAFWAGANLYENAESSSIQSLSLVGRYHGQYWTVDSDSGNANGWDNRRMIFGVQSGLYDDYVIDLQMHINDSFSPVYDGLYTASLSWEPAAGERSLILGRLDYVYTGLERTTSSKRLVTFERGLLAAQLMPGEVVGVHAETQISDLSLRPAIYSGQIGDEFSDFSAGAAYGLGLSYPARGFYDKGTLNLDVLYNDGNALNNAFEPYRQIISVWHQGQKGRFRLGIDVTAGQDEFSGAPDVYGVTLIPTYDVADTILLDGDRLQFAMRYQYAVSDGDNGLQIPRRYEREVTVGEGDRYDAIYLGLNYLIYGDRLKMMVGAEYSEMRDDASDGGDYQGWTYMGGLRFYF